MPVPTAKLAFSDAVLAEISLNFNEIKQNSGPDKTLSKIQAGLDIFGPDSNPNKRYVWQEERIAQYARFLKGLGLKVVYTAGVWDLPHIGHGRYLQEAKQLGDILIVGAELDSAVKLRKGPNRPIMPFRERVEMLCHFRHVDLVVPVADYDERGFSGLRMIEVIQPDSFVASKRSFNEADDTEQWIKRVSKYCQNGVKILESQAETSTSAKIRDLIIQFKDLVNKEVEQAEITINQTLDVLMQSLIEVVNKSKEDMSKAQKQAFTELKEKANNVVK